MLQHLNDKNILLIDPEDDIERILRKELPSSCRIHRISSGRNGLKKIKSSDPDIILCQLRTRDIDGKTVFRNYIADEDYTAFQGVPFVILSDTEVRDNDAIELFELGLSGWYKTSLTPSDFTEVLGNLFLQFQNVKNNRELRQEVKRTEYRYRDLLENPNDFIFILDDHGKFIFLNNRFTPLTGLDKNEWIGRKFIQVIEKDDQPHALKHYKMAHHGKARIFEARVIHPDVGSTVLSFNITPFFEHGTVAGSLGIARDVSEQKKMEKEILDLKNFNESIIQSMEAGLLTTDLEGRFTSLNAGAERIMGVKAKDVIGKSISSVLKPKEAETLLGSIPPPRSPRYSREMVLTVKNGNQVAIGFTATDRIDNTGEKLGKIVSFRDISELKQMQSEVMRMDRLASLGVLASGIAHEIKNPLAGIKTMAQACEEEFQQEDPRREYLIRIVRQVNRLDDLLKTFFAYARPKPPDRKLHGIEPILNEVMNLVNKKLSICGIAYKKSIHSDLSKIMVDSQQIQQVFLNLILNAIEAMTGGGTLRIAAKNINGINQGQGKKRVEILVSDTGTGIGETDLQTIFDPFFTTKSNGLGLGLSIVYRIIQEHQGDIHVKSQIGKGTTFMIRLPAGV